MTANRVKATMSLPRCFTLFVIVAGLVMPAVGAQAQYYGATPQQPPLYPYAVRGDRPNAVEGAPVRNYPYVGRDVGKAEPKALASDRPRRRADRAPIEELRKRPPLRRKVINTKKIVHDRPVVVETRRFVDDPPRVIERRHVVEDTDKKKRGGRDAIKRRVIEADAEIIIFGPDRMSIRLFRKGRSGNTNARAK